VQNTARSLMDAVYLQEKDPLMIRRLLTLLLVGSVSFAIQGCTYRAWYEGFKAQQRHDCYRYASQEERQECLDKVNSLTYEQYMNARKESNKLGISGIFTNK
jgi:hypothetical protein